MLDRARIHVAAEFIGCSRDSGLEAKSGAVLKLQLLLALSLGSRGELFRLTDGPEVKEQIGALAAGREQALRSALCQFDFGLR